MFGDGLADVGEGRALAYRARRNARPEGENGDDFAGVIGARPGGIAAVIGGEDNEVAGHQCSLQFGYAFVERFQRGGIARHIAAMSVGLVEVDEVREGDGIIRHGLGAGDGRIEDLCVAVGLQAHGDSAAREDVGDLSDAHHLVAFCFHDVEQRRCVRRRGIVVAIARALELTGLFADEGPGDDAPDIVLVHQLARDEAEFVEPPEAKVNFMRSDLKHGIRRRVTDRLTRLDVLQAKLLDDLGARGVTIGQDAGKLRLSNQCIRQFGGEGGNGAREIAPVVFDRQTHHFPMPARRVFALAQFRRTAIAAGDRARRHDGNIWVDFVRGQPQPQREQVGDLERARAPVAGDISAGARGGDVTEGVGARIPEAFGIRCGAEAKGIENCYDRSQIVPFRMPIRIPFCCSLDSNIVPRKPGLVHLRRPLVTQCA